MKSRKVSMKKYLKEKNLWKEVGIGKQKFEEIKCSSKLQTLSVEEKYLLIQYLIGSKNIKECTHFMKKNKRKIILLPVKSQQVNSNDLIDFLESCEKHLNETDLCAEILFDFLVVFTWLNRIIQEIEPVLLRFKIYSDSFKDLIEKNSRIEIYAQLKEIFALEKWKKVLINKFSGQVFFGLRKWKNLEYFLLNYESII